MASRSKNSIGSALFVLIVIVFLGPSPETPLYDNELPILTVDLDELSETIDSLELSNNKIKLNNEARIVWNDTTHSQTDWAIVYLHGFTASQMEGDPTHIRIAEKFKMNLFLARLSDHGLESDSALLELTADRLWESAKVALMIGRRIGKKVILMSTSTGGTLALKLAEQYPDLVDGLVNYSPNVRINNKFAFLMNNPWGLSLIKLMSEEGYVVTSGANDSTINQYWNTRYRVEALTQLQELLETTMVEDVFNAVTCPSLTVAYFKDEENQDPTVKVSAMRWMHEELGTDSSWKEFVELTNVGVHPMASGIRSKDLESLENVTSQFIERLLLK